MANPAATGYDLINGITGVQSQVPGARFEMDVEISLVGVTYVTNGLTVASLCTGLPFTTITHFLPTALGPTLDSTVNDFSYDRANSKVKLYNVAAAVNEVGNGTPLDNYKLYAHVCGRR